ncbi:MAG TPA: DUF448 domain-containing protein [Caldisericia bacterium]|nr:DUF448 domain-containing protein [Caldisericia bacterium]HPQ92592.1 DUF448 domain-containing protein [Caldisericia bacterium]HRV74310.1 DUF448 domain-containing protein [Caldisericia bacterium]
MPERTCVVCGKKDEKDRMYRISSNLELDRTQRQPGRGAYICKDSSCISALSRGKTTIRRSLRNVKVNKSDLAPLSEMLTHEITNPKRCDLTREFNG